MSKRVEHIDLRPARVRALNRKWQWQDRMEGRKAYQKRKAKREEWISELVFLAVVFLGVTLLMYL